MPLAPPQAEGDIRLIDIAWAATSPKAAKEIEVKAGDKVNIVGFVSDSQPGGNLQISRFSVGCCAADGTAYGVNVTNAPEDLPLDTWVQVKGVLAGKPGVDFHIAATPSSRSSSPTTRTSSCSRRTRRAA